MASEAHCPRATRTKRQRERQREREREEEMGGKEREKREVEESRERGGRESPVHQSSNRSQAVRSAERFMAGFEKWSSGDMPPATCLNRCLSWMRIYCTEYHKVEC